MALLSEYALTTDVFDVTSYSNDEVCGLHLQAVKDGLLHERLVRNLQSGDWGGQGAGSKNCLWQRRRNRGPGSKDRSRPRWWCVDR